jgi:hypothetical protein
MGGRCGSTCSTQTWLDDLGDRPPYRVRPQDGPQIPGRRRQARGTCPDPFDQFVDYVTARLLEDPHLWARTLFDEPEDLGFGLSYQSLTRNIRTRNLRPVCQTCRTATERPNAVITRPPGDETQWDWLELPNPPESWGWGKTANLLVGSLAHSGKWRAALSASTDQPHLVAALDRVVRRRDRPGADRRAGHLPLTWNRRPTFC